MKVAVDVSEVDGTDRISVVATASPKVNPVAITPAVAAPSTLDDMLNRARSGVTGKRRGWGKRPRAEVRKKKKKEKSH